MEASLWRVLLIYMLLVPNLTALDQTPAPGVVPGPVLPPGLQVVQLDGNLVCPPCMVRGNGILVACDDRTVSLLGTTAQRVWRRELDRGILGPLTTLSAGMVLVPLSGGQVACLGMDGRVYWQRRIVSAGDYSLAGTPDGRIIKVEPSGVINVLNPDASSLFMEQLPLGLGGVPRLVADGLELLLSDGTVWILHWNGALAPFHRLLSSTSATDNLEFRAENKNDGSYRVRVSSVTAFLDFTAPGKIGHWLADNNLGTLVVWGDSLWRCYIFAPREPVQPNVMPKMADKTVADGAFLLETHYLQALINDSSLSGTDEAILHISTMIGTGKLAGRLDMYEEILLGIVTTKRGAVYKASADQRVKAINALARFPSLSQLDRLARQLLIEEDIAVLAAILDFGANLGIDPEGKLQMSIRTRQPIWAAAGMLPTLGKSIKILEKVL